MQQDNDPKQSSKSKIEWLSWKRKKICGPNILHNDVTDWRSHTEDDHFIIAAKGGSTSYLIIGWFYKTQFEDLQKEFQIFDLSIIVYCYATLNTLRQKVRRQQNLWLYFI